MSSRDQIFPPFMVYVEYSDGISRYPFTYFTGSSFWMMVICKYYRSLALIHCVTNCSQSRNLSCMSWLTGLAASHDVRMAVDDPKWYVFKHLVLQKLAVWMPRRCNTCLIEPEETECACNFQVVMTCWCCVQQPPIIIDPLLSYHRISGFRALALVKSDGFPVGEDLYHSRTNERVAAHRSKGGFPYWTICPWQLHPPNHQNKPRQ